MKKSQLIMIWFLPLIVIGGLFVPLLGYLVLAMMAFFLTLAYFKGRYWCWNLCSRGSFLDIVVSKFSPNRANPRIFSKPLLRWTVFAIFSIFLILRILNSGGNLITIGAIFVGICLLTTLISIILGITLRHRGWCAICPMGTLQDKIAELGRRKK